MTAYDRRIYSGNAKPTTISSAIGSGDTSIACGDLTGWPDGSGTKRAFATIEVDGNASQERITYTGKTGNTLTGVTRGADDTSAATHLAGAQIIHSHSKTDLDEANAHVTDTTRNDHTQYLRSTDVIAGKLIGIVSYAVSGNGTFTITTDGTLRAIDTTHLALTFTVPASGKVIVVQHAQIGGTGGGGYMMFGLRVHGASTQVGIKKYVYNDTAGIGAATVAAIARQYITGLTPGSATWDFAYQANNGLVIASGTDEFYCPVVMEVYAA